MHGIDFVILVIVAILIYFAFKSTKKHFGGKGGCCGCSGCSGGSCCSTSEESALENSPKVSSASEKASIEKLLYIEGMHCDTCKKSVESALTATRGVVLADVDLNLGTARVALNQKISDGALRSAIEVKGFKVRRIS